MSDIPRTYSDGGMYTVNNVELGVLSGLVSWSLGVSTEWLFASSSAGFYMYKKLYTEHDVCI